MSSLFQSEIQDPRRDAGHEPEGTSEPDYWQGRQIPIIVASFLWLLLATMFFLPAVAFVALEAGPLWLFSVIVIPAIPLTMFALVVSKPTPNRLRLSLVAGIALVALGVFLAWPQSPASSPSTGQALLLVGLGVALSSAVALRSRLSVDR